MAYKNNFVVAIKHQGQILREKDNTVILPFGSEYSILLKNLDSRRAVAKVEIDGKDVLGGRQLIIEPNSTLELERFLDNLDEGNRFKFIKKTKETIEQRGDHIEDGIVRVEFRFEKAEREEIVHVKKYYDWYPCYRPNPCPWYTYKVWCSNYDNTSDISYNYKTHTLVPIVFDTVCYSSINVDDSEVATPADDEGITVRGSKSYQKFHYGYTKDLENQSSVIILRLRGLTKNNIEVTKPITVKDKLICPTCGKKCSSKDRYCSSCGTYLG